MAASSNCPPDRELGLGSRGAGEPEGLGDFGSEAVEQRAVSGETGPLGKGDLWRTWRLWRLWRTWRMWRLETKAGERKLDADKLT